MQRVATLARGVRAAQRVALSRAITLVESSKPEHQIQARELMRQVLAADAGAPRSVRVAVSGPPGAGKSTFIEALGSHVLAQQHRLAVLSIDPSSVVSGGSILGDKTRMVELTRNERAFVRPSPSRGTLGGVGAATQEAIVLCEAAGYDVVIVETVGVGQSEIAVRDMVDMYLLLVPPGGGDELQGMKKGVVEISDLIVVNKADGSLLKDARLAYAHYQSAQKYVRQLHPSWKPRVAMCSSTEGTGVADVWTAIQDFAKDKAAIKDRRGRQNEKWMWAHLQHVLHAQLHQQPGTTAWLQDLSDQVYRGVVASQEASHRILERYCQLHQASSAGRDSSSL